MDERNYKEILKQAQQILYCTTCGRTYQLNEIRLRGFLDDTIILQTICSNGHAPVVTFYMTNSTPIEAGVKKVNLSHKANESSPRRVTKDDVLDLHQGLKEFNGDFRHLWNMT